MKHFNLKQKLAEKADEAYDKLDIEEKTDEFKEKIKLDERTEKVKKKVNYDKNSAKVKAGLSKFKAKRKKIIALTVVFVIVFLLAVELISVPVLYSLVFKAGSDFFARNTYSDESIAWADGLGKDEFTESSDGTELHALYIKNKNFSGSYIIMCHPYGTDAKYMLRCAEHYYDLGFNILLADARGHGESGGKFRGLGWLDRLDIISWVNKIIADDEKARIVIHGIGMGGTAALTVSGEKLPENVRVIIAEDCYTSVWELFKYQANDLFSIPSFPLLDVLSAYTKHRAGWDFKEASALEQVKKSEVPTLFIHGGCNSIIPIKEGNLLYDACTAKKKQMVISSADFGLCEKTDPDKYHGEIDRFLLNNLGQITENRSAV